MIPFSSSELKVALEELVVGYAACPVAGPISVSIPPGAALGITGRNGAGKTTLLRTIAGHLPPVSGRIYYGSTAVESYSIPERVRAGVGVAISREGLPKTLRVGEVLDLMRLVGDPGRVQESVKRFPEIESRSSHYVWQLSGGEQQLLAITKAIALAEHVCILDELSEGLFPETLERVIEALRGMLSRGVAALVANASIEPLSRSCDYISELVDGQLLLASRP